MDYWRQLDIVPSDKLSNLSVTLIGCGGIGSPTALCLTKMGIRNLLLIDPDTVDYHNLTSTMYQRQHTKRSKAKSLARMLKTFSDNTLAIGHKGSFDVAATLPRGIVISGVDSMASRAEIWRGMKYNVNRLLYIDGRMAGQVGRILAVRPCTPSKIAWYESTLFTDEESEDIPCTNRAIIYNTFMISSLICEHVKRFTCEEFIPREKIFDFVTNTYLVSKEEA